MKKRPNAAGNDFLTLPRPMLSAIFFYFSHNDTHRVTNCI